MSLPWSHLQFARTGVHIGSYRVCRSRCAQRVEEDAASRLRSSVRFGRRRFRQPSGVSKQRVAEDVASRVPSSVRVCRPRIWQPSGGAEAEMCRGCHQAPIFTSRGQASISAAIGCAEAEMRRGCLQAAIFSSRGQGSISIAIGDSEAERR